MKLKDDADAIEEAYSRVVRQFKAWMENNVSVEDYRDLLLDIPGTMKKNIPLLKDRWDDIKNANHKDCSALLYQYHTWFNCSVLKTLLQRARNLTKKDPTDVLCSLQSYTEDMFKYCKRNIFECSSPSGMSSTKGKTYFTLKMVDSQLPDKKQFTAEEIQLFTAKIRTSFEIHEPVLQLCTFTEGCVELVYSIPLCIHDEVFPLSVDQRRYLTTLGVTEITTKDYHYRLYQVSNIHLEICSGYARNYITV